MNTWLSGAAFVGVAAALWNRLRSVGHRLIGLLIVRASVEGDAASALGFYCWTRLKRSPFGDRRYRSFLEYVRPVRRYMHVVYECVSTDPAIFWRGWRPLAVGSFAGDPTRPFLQGSTTLSFLRGTWGVDSLLADAMRAWNKARHENQEGISWRYGIERLSGSGGARYRQTAGQGKYGQSPSDVASNGAPNDKPTLGDCRVIGWNPDDIGPERDARDPWSALAYPAEVVGLVTEVRRWLKAEKWFSSKRIPWRLGIMLCGAPGTGKSAFVRALARDLDLPILVFDLGSMSNREFLDHWKGLLNRVPCIALLEDFDATFKGRTNKLGEEGGGLTFDCVLNCLSGVESADGVLTIVTTNKPEELDPAMGVLTERGISTRPGRIDRIIELPALDEAGRYKIASRILQDYPEEIDRLVELGDGDTGAQFQDRCGRAAIERFWSEPAGNRNGDRVSV